MDSSSSTNITVINDETVSVSNIDTNINNTDINNTNNISIEEDIYNMASETNDVRDINLPRSEVGYCMNSRNQKLHFRMYYKHHEPIHSVIIYLHGYAGHVNRPTYPYFIQECLKDNIALVCLDFHGHGYSEGTMAYVEDQDHLLDDVTSLLRYIYNEELNLRECSFNEHTSGHHKHKKKDVSSGASNTTTHSEEYDHFNLVKSQVPFYIMGQSMGGAVAIRLGVYYSDLMKNSTNSNVSSNHNDNKSEEEEVSCIGTSGIGISDWFNMNRNYSINTETYKHPSDIAFASCFKGVILLAPAVYNKLPPAIVRMTFEHILVPLFPTANIPKMLSGAVDDYTTIWNSDKFVEYVAVKDRHHIETNPHALSFGESIRFKTAHSIVNMMEQVQVEIPKIDFPFIVFHDPEDAVILYDGSILLMEESKTSIDKKHLYVLPNAKHDLFSNRLSIIVKLTLDWIKKDIRSS